MKYNNNNGNNNNGNNNSENNAVNLKNSVDLTNYTDVLVLGVAGNFAGHLKQAGEADDFAKIATGDINQPQALFPIYVPSESDSFLTNFPLSHDAIQLPVDVPNLQIEPEVALLCDVIYDQGEVVELIPKSFGAFNDCSIRRPNANKISEKKNWGTASKGVAHQMIPLSSLTAGSEVDRFRIASFHQSGNIFAAYGEDCSISDYTYFYETLLLWVKERINQQKDIGPLEHILGFVQESGYPQQILLAIGATRYTNYGETHFLQRGDVSIVVVYDHEQYTPEQIQSMARRGDLVQQGLSTVIQTVY